MNDFARYNYEPIPYHNSVSPELLSAAEEMALREIAEKTQSIANEDLQIIVLRQQIIDLKAASFCCPCEEVTCDDCYDRDRKRREIQAEILDCVKAIHNYEAEIKDLKERV